MADDTTSLSKQLVTIRGRAQKYFEQCVQDLAEVHPYSGFTEYMDIIQAAFPDFTNHVEEIISEDDGAFVRLTHRGTHLSRR